MHIDDDWYEELVNAHQGLSDTQGQRLDAALVLLLANQVADLPALRACLHDARTAVLGLEND
ncbi:MAG TPA: DUF2783 domain-containing protein [Steroidobacteraceae bacterium]|nr:DUF2783 domain-containing protein [Steroidobacteraceae bacterium]